MMHELREQKATRIHSSNTAVEPALYTNSYRLLLHTLSYGLPRKLDMIPGIVGHILEDVRKPETNGDRRRRLCIAISEELHNPNVPLEQAPAYHTLLKIIAWILAEEFPGDTKLRALVGDLPNRQDIHCAVLLEKLRDIALIAPHLERIEPPKEAKKSSQPRCWFSC